MKEDLEIKKSGYFPSSDRSSIEETKEASICKLACPTNTDTLKVREAGQPNQAILHSQN